MPLVWNIEGPLNLPGQVFTAALGTAVAFSAGVAVAYTGLALANPKTPAGQVPVKLIPLRAELAPTTVSLVNAPVPWGILKLTGQGTASNGGLSAFSGSIFSPGFAGTAVTGTSPAGVGSCIAQVGGTFSVINGTAAGTGSNTLYWQELCGCLGVGTATNYASPNAAVDLQGFTSVMPGETIALAANIAVTGLASISWLEVPMNSGS